MRRLLPILCGLALLGSGATRKSEVRRRLVGRQAIAGSAAGAGFRQLMHSPRQWGGPIGYARRFGSSLGTHVAKNAIELGVAAVHNENLKYRRSNRRGTLPRLKYAVKHTFIVPRRTKRGNTVALARISGNMGAGMISQTWMPAAGVGAGVATGGIGLGADVGANVAREFWPRKHNPRKRTRVMLASRRNPARRARTPAPR